MTPFHKKWACFPKIFSLFSRKLSLKKLFDEKILKISFPIKKILFIFSIKCSSLQKVLASSTTPKRFSAIFSENAVFLKKQLNNQIFDKRCYVNFWGKRFPFPKKLSNVPLKQFFTVFSENTAVFEKIVELKKYSASNL